MKAGEFSGDTIISRNYCVLNYTVACLFLIIDVVNIASSFTAKQWRKILVNLATRAINILSTINLKAAEVDLFQIFLMSLFIN